LDASESPASRRLLADLEATGTFHVRPYPDRAAIDRALLGGEIGVAVVLPPDLERDRIRRGRPEIQVLYDGTEVVLAGNSEASIRGLMTATALDQLGLRASVAAVGGAAAGAHGVAPVGRAAGGAASAPGRGIQIVPHVLFNPRLDGVPFMVS